MSTKLDFNKPRLDTVEGAAYIGCSPYTLRKSRTTGTLFGMPAPKFKKRGRNITYEREELDVFDDQFNKYQNTAEYGER